MPVATLGQKLLSLQQCGVPRPELSRQIQSHLNHDEMCCVNMCTACGAFVFAGVLCRCARREPAPPPHSWESPNSTHRRVERAAAVTGAEAHASINDVKEAPAQPHTATSLLSSPPFSTASAASSLRHGFVNQRVMVNRSNLDSDDCREQEQDEGCILMMPEVERRDLIQAHTSDVTIGAHSTTLIRPHGMENPCQLVFLKTFGDRALVDNATANSRLRYERV
jgi:hypothetical protein